MNSFRKLPFILVGGIIFTGILIGNKPKKELGLMDIKPGEKVTEIKFTFPEDRKPKSLKDSIKEMANRLGKKIYEYELTTEIIPHSNLYRISKSGYQQYEVRNVGAKYSITKVRFYTDKKLTYQDAIKFANKHPEYCIPVPLDSKSDFIDDYHDKYDEYSSDPENEIDFAPIPFDFLAD